MKKDSKLVGLMVGLVAPLLGMCLFWLFAFGLSGLRDMGVLFSQTQRLAAVVSLGLIANLPAFYLFYSKKRDQSAQGVIMATLAYGLLIVLLKFVL